MAIRNFVNYVIEKHWILPQEKHNNSAPNFYISIKRKRFIVDKRYKEQLNSIKHYSVLFGYMYSQSFIQGSRIKMGSPVLYYLRLRSFYNMAEEG